MKVFVVDDSRVIRERLVALISGLACVEVIGEARDACDAIRDIRALNPDVVILDIRMPGESGIDVLDSVRKAKNPPKVIMLTNYPFPQYRRKCMDAGADFFLDKSTEFEKVADILKQIAENSRETNDNEGGT